MKYKQNNKNRKRSIELGIKASEEERDQLKAICSKLGVTKIQFLVQAMEQYKELTI